jgi:hypothetical protein
MLLVFSSKYLDCYNCASSSCYWSSVQNICKKTQIDSTFSKSVCKGIDLSIKSDSVTFETTSNGILINFIVNVFSVNALESSFNYVTYETKFVFIFKQISESKFEDTSIQYAKYTSYFTDNKHNYYLSLPNKLQNPTLLKVYIEINHKSDVQEISKLNNIAVKDLSLDDESLSVCFKYVPISKISNIPFSDLMKSVNNDLSKFFINNKEGYFLNGNYFWKDSGNLIYTKDILIGNNSIEISKLSSMNLFLGKKISYFNGFEVNKIYSYFTNCEMKTTQQLPYQLNEIEVPFLGGLKIQFDVLREYSFSYFSK